MNAQPIEHDIDKALEEVRRIATAGGNQSEISYFGHIARYRRSLKRVTSLCPPGARILDVGSHYLHQAVALKLLGYDVVGMDVCAFAGQASIQSRARSYGIENRIVDRFDRGDFLEEYSDAFDLILFTEILEHITFNPVRFWLRIYELMKSGSLIYLTTPNALRSWNMASVIKNVIVFRGIGVPVAAIFSCPTYGHHWKEYSAAEIRSYFSSLSSDFSISVMYYNCRPGKTDAASIKQHLEQAIRWVSGFAPAFREELDVVVRLRAKTSWLIDPAGIAY